MIPNRHQIPSPPVLSDYLDDATFRKLISHQQRFETAYYRGSEVSPNYDPLLAKILEWAPSRILCVEKLARTLTKSVIVGPCNNLQMLAQFVQSVDFKEGRTYTASTLDKFVKEEFVTNVVEVVRPGLSTTVQDWPGREGPGLWRIGIPPSGAADHLGCRLANVLVGNEESLAVLEALAVPSSPLVLKIWGEESLLSVCGASCKVVVSGDQQQHGGGSIFQETEVPMFSAVALKKGDTITITRRGSDEEGSTTGTRIYVGVRGGIDVPVYLGSRATFVKGNFGGHQGRELRAGDQLPIGVLTSTTQQILSTLSSASFPMTECISEISDSSFSDSDYSDEGTFPPKSLVRASLPPSLQPSYFKFWEIGVLPGPRANPEYLTDEAIDMLHSTDWLVHHNSNRLGIRLIGPKPTWTRSDGGEGGSHPSNIHDEVYAVGTVNFTGDMPIIITHDGPSLGGFVCPMTISQSEMWKVGQIGAGDSIKFRVLKLEAAVRCGEGQRCGYWIWNAIHQTNGHVVHETCSSRPAPVLVELLCVECHHDVMGSCVGVVIMKIGP